MCTDADTWITRRDFKGFEFPDRDNRIAAIWRSQGGKQPTFIEICYNQWTKDNTETLTSRPATWHASYITRLIGFYLGTNEEELTTYCNLMKQYDPEDPHKADPEAEIIELALQSMSRVYDKLNDILEKHLVTRHAGTHTLAVGPPRQISMK